MAETFLWQRVRCTSTGVCPQRPQVRLTSGDISRPLSSMNTSQALRCAVFFNAGPVLGHPAFNLFLVTLNRQAPWALGAKPEGAQQPANMVWVIADAETP